MIGISYRGNTGNNVFQYVVARLLAEETGLALNALSIPEFPELTSLPGRTGTGPEFKLLDCHFWRPDAIRSLAHDLRDRRFILRGNFEVYSALEPYADRIRSWFHPQIGHIDGAAVHIRGTDHMRMGRLPRDYYLQALEIVGRENAVIYTDDPNWEFVRQFGLPIVSGTKMGDWSSIRASSRIVLSLSTYSWWAAFLSQATTVVQPWPTRGFRSDHAPTTVIRVPSWTSVQCNPLWSHDVEEFNGSVAQQ
jgi:8-oxo-dGTP pyrophosphatase MutT (NUDIX family)